MTPDELKQWLCIGLWIVKTTCKCGKILKTSLFIPLFTATNNVWT